MGTTVAIQRSYFAVYGVTGVGFSEVLSNHARAQCEVLRGLLSVLRDLLCGLGLMLRCVVRQQKCGVKCMSVGVYVQCEVLYF